MALINCPECTKQISDAAPACPQCGFPLPKTATAVPPPAEMLPPPPVLPVTHYQPYQPQQAPVATPQHPSAYQPTMAPPTSFVEPPSRPGSGMAVTVAILMLLALVGFGWGGIRFWQLEDFLDSSGYSTAASSYYADIYSRNYNESLATPTQLAAQKLKTSALAQAYNYYRSKRDSLEMETLIALGIGGGLAFIGSIFFYIWLYQSWKSIPPLEREISPGKAVGMLFIPFFNFYWLFVAIPGLSGNLSRSLGKRGIFSGAGKGLAITACILTLLAGPLGLLLQGIWVLMANHAKNKLLKTVSAV